MRSSARDVVRNRSESEGTWWHLATWKPVFAQTVRDVWATNGPEWAAALGFYAVLSLFPLLIAGVIVASYLAEPSWAAERFTTLVEKFLPSDDLDVRSIVDAAITQRQRVGVLAVVVFLVTGRRVLGALSTALNLFSDAEERDDHLKRRVLVEFGLFIGVTTLFVLALLANPLIDLAWRTVGVLPFSKTLTIGIAVELVQALLTVTIFATIYAFVPSGQRYWRAVFLGAAVASLFYLAQGIFVVILGWLSETLRLLYGPLAPAALLLIWAWYVALITLVGGAVASHTKVMVIEGHGAKEAGRRHVSHKSAGRKGKDSGLRTQDSADRPS